MNRDYVRARAWIEFAAALLAGAGGQSDDFGVKLAAKGADRMLAQFDERFTVDRNDGEWTTVSTEVYPK